MLTAMSMSLAVTTVELQVVYSMPSSSPTELLVHGRLLHPFFFLMIPRPPRYTLFPYTTPFRSRRAVQRGPRRSGRAREVPGRRYTLRWLRDRKSTRLNSSHGYISYAVFCLK